MSIPHDEPIFTTIPELWAKSASYDDLSLPSVGEAISIQVTWPYDPIRVGQSIQFKNADGSFAASGEVESLSDNGFTVKITNYFEPCLGQCGTMVDPEDAYCDECWKSLHVDEFFDPDDSGL